MVSRIMKIFGFYTLIFLTGKKKMIYLFLKIKLHQKNNQTKQFKQTKKKKVYKIPTKRCINPINLALTSSMKNKWAFYPYIIALFPHFRLNRTHCEGILFLFFISLSER